MSRSFQFTSESVTEGHPDKLADQISDAILDALLAQDPGARVAASTICHTGMVVLFGEISTQANVDYVKITRDTLCDIGYNHTDYGMDFKGCAVLSAFNKQSPDIACGVSHSLDDPQDQGAGDQGMMFGYAVDETPEFMPMPIMLAHRLVRQQASLRHQGQLAWLRPDGKAQVTLRYQDDQPVAIDTIVFSTQHSPDISIQALREAVIEEIIKPVLPTRLARGNIQYLVNPTGRFVIGGPQGDSGLTGRKLMVDTYGSSAPHGGGAFSGKDPSKVDRSASYAARYIAKNLVAAGLAKKCLIQVSYAIGVARPTSLMVNTFGTGKCSDQELESLIARVFDWRPRKIIQTLQLLKPIYRKTACYGHFGREEPDFTWEQCNLVESLTMSI